MSVWERLFATELLAMVVGIALAWFGDKIDEDDISVIGGVLIIFAFVALVATSTGFIWTH